MTHEQVIEAIDEQLHEWGFSTHIGRDHRTIRVVLELNTLDANIMFSGTNIEGYPQCYGAFKLDVFRVPLADPKSFYKLKCFLRDLPQRRKELYRDTSRLMAENLKRIHKT